MSYREKVWVRVYYLSSEVVIFPLTIDPERPYHFDSVVCYHDELISQESPAQAILYMRDKIERDGGLWADSEDSVLMFVSKYSVLSIVAKGHE